MTGSEKTQDESQPKITRAKLDSLCLYEVTEGELEIIEQGSPNSIYLNFSIFLLSVGLSFLATLLTVEIESQKKFIVFIIITIIALIVGLLLLILWYTSRNSFTETIKKIKQRLPCSTQK